MINAPSESYQHIWNEVSIDNYDNIIVSSDIDLYSEEFETLNNAAIKRIFVIMKHYLTEEEQSVINMILNGTTQWQMADLFGLKQQSSMGKRIRGEHGIYNKIQAYIRTDIIFQQIIKQMAELD